MPAGRLRGEHFVSPNIFCHNSHSAIRFWQSRDGNPQRFVSGPRGATGGHPQPVHCRRGWGGFGPIRMANPGNFTSPHQAVDNRLEVAKINNWRFLLALRVSTCWFGDPKQQKSHRPRFPWLATWGVPTRNPQISRLNKFVVQKDLLFLCLTPFMQICAAQRRS